MDSNIHIPELPQELVTEILIRLPVKSLIRFQSLSKHHLNLFKSPTFIADHLRHSRRRNSSLIMINLGCRNLNLLQDDRLTVVDIHDLFGQRYEDIDDYFEVVGCSNGLVCLREDPSLSFCVYKIWILNPATRQVTRIYPIYHPIDEDIISSTGFGFDISSNDYKIVIMRIYEYRNFKASASVSVFSLAANNWNRTIHCLKDIRRVKRKSNGAIYWIGISKFDRQDVVVSFDLAAKVFKTVGMPSCAIEYFKVVAVVEDSPALFFFQNTSFEGLNIDLWVLQDDVNGCWTKLRSISVEYKLRSISVEYCSWVPITVWKNQIVLLGTNPRGHNDEQCVILVSSGQSGKVLCKFGGASPSAYDTSAYTYAESLVPVD